MFRSGCSEQKKSYDWMNAPAVEMIEGLGRAFSQKFRKFFGTEKQFPKLRSIHFEELVFEHIFNTSKNKLNNCKVT